MKCSSLYIGVTRYHSVLLILCLKETHCDTCITYITCQESHYVGVMNHEIIFLSISTLKQEIQVIKSDVSVHLVPL